MAPRAERDLQDALIQKFKDFRVLTSKATTKVLLFFDMTKFFWIFLEKTCIFC